MNRRTAAGLIVLPALFFACVIGCQRDTSWEYHQQNDATDVERLRALESRVARLEMRPLTILVKPNRPARAFQPLPGVRR